MNNIADLQAILIDTIGNKNSHVRTIVESHTDPQDIVDTLLLLGYSQGKDSELLSELFSLSAEHSPETEDEEYIKAVSKLIDNIFHQ